MFDFLVASEQIHLSGSGGSRIHISNVFVYHLVWHISRYIVIHLNTLNHLDLWAVNKMVSCR